MKKNIIIASVLLLSGFCIQACEDGELYPDKMFLEVKISTNLGDVIVELNRNRAPITVNNFLKYVKNKAYNNTIIHRVESDFVIQGGGYDKEHKDIESCGKIFNESGNGLKNTKGTIAMARYDNPHSATSQFYFNLNQNESLDPGAKNWGYTVFGEVIEGMDVLEKISKMRTGYHEDFDSTSFPMESIIIKSVELE